MKTRRRSHDSGRHDHLLESEVMILTGMTISSSQRSCFWQIRPFTRVGGHVSGRYDHLLESEVIFLADTTIYSSQRSYLFSSALFPRRNGQLSFQVDHCEAAAGVLRANLPDWMGRLPSQPWANAAFAGNVVAVINRGNCSGQNHCQRPRWIEMKKIYGLFAV